MPEGTADSYNQTDYSSYSGTLTFAVGTTTQTLRVPLSNDLGVEASETFFLQLANAKNASGNLLPISNNLVIATIIDNDSTVTDVSGNGTIDANEKANLSVRDVVVDETAGTATFDLVLSKATSSNFSVAYSTAAGTAAAGTDFTTATGSVAFAAGQTSQRVIVNIVNDTTIEGNEYFHLNLGAISGSSEVVVADGVGTAFIGANDQPAVASPSVLASDIVVNEADGYAEFVVRLSAPASSTVTVQYSLPEGTADSYNQTDYSRYSGTLTFAAGTTTQAIRVPVTDNNVGEGTETFILKLTDAKNASGNLLTIASPQVTAHIIDNDNGGEEFLYGLGNDVYNINHQDQRVYETNSGGIDTVQSRINYSLADTDGGNVFGGNVENLTLVGTAAINGTGNALNNVLTGNGAANILIGGAGNDTLNGGAGKDVLKGGAGDDIYINTTGDTITELANEGIDTVQSAVNVVLSANIENVILTGAAAVNATGNKSANTIYVNAGSHVNVIDGIANTAGTDTLSYQYATTNGTTGVTVNLSGAVDASGYVTARGISGADKIKNIGNLVGSDYGDALTGNAGANLLDGGLGNDTLSGGSGNDTYRVNATGDIVIESANSGIDLVESTVSYSLMDTDGTGSLGGNVENLRLLGTGNINATGNKLANVIYANNGVNIIDGVANASGTDTLSYQYSTTTGLVGVTVNLGGSLDAKGYVTASGISGLDKIKNIGNLIGSDYADTLTGNANANALSGGLGNDTLIGGAGKDTLVGGNGKDIFDFNALSEMGTTSTTADVISDFVRGQDKIDLSTLDANTATKATNEAFSGTLIAAAASFTAAGQLKLVSGVLYGNTDADATAEFAIALTGISTLTAADFIL